jgi:hypothetical protein
MKASHEAALADINSAPKEVQTPKTPLRIALSDQPVPVSVQCRRPEQIHLADIGQKRPNRSEINAIYRYLSSLIHND